MIDGLLLLLVGWGGVDRKILRSYIRSLLFSSFRYFPPTFRFPLHSTWYCRTAIHTGACRVGQRAGPFQKIKSCACRHSPAFEFLPMLGTQRIVAGASRAPEQMSHGCDRRHKAAAFSTNQEEQGMAILSTVVSLSL